MLVILMMVKMYHAKIATLIVKHASDKTFQAACHVTNHKIDIWKDQFVLVIMDTMMISNLVLACVAMQPVKPV